MLVGQIAWDHTQPAARERVTELVRTLETTYNEGQPYNFITAGCWMDDMRSKPRYAWSKWHYVTIPWTPDASAFAIPPSPHVVWAIRENLKTLRDAASTPEEAALALAMLIHFAGDVHQPLHATDRGDRGGNGVLIRGVPFTDLWPGTVANLHAFWDKAFRFDAREDAIAEMWVCPNVAGRPKAPGEGVIAEEATKIVTQNPRSALANLIEISDPETWARESHTIGCASAYPKDFEPSDTHVTTLTPDFAAASRPIAERRVALAGYRLAKLLNEIFAPAPAP